MFFAFVTVLFTVHAYVFYSLYIVHGDMFIANTHASGVLAAINMMGGVPVLGINIPIWAVVLIEFIIAYTMEMLLGSLLSFKIACHYFDPRKNHPFIFETMIISATVFVMCPVMSFIAAILYYPYNFPFAFFSQLFFIQPLVRTIFKFVFRKDLQKRNEEAKGEKMKPHDETEAIAAIYKRVDEIKEELKKELEAELVHK